MRCDPPDQIKAKANKQALPAFPGQPLPNRSQPRPTSSHQKPPYAHEEHPYATAAVFLSLLTLQPKKEKKKSSARLRASERETECYP